MRSKELEEKKPITENKVEKKALLDFCDEIDNLINTYKE